MQRGAHDSSKPSKAVVLLPLFMELSGVNNEAIAGGSSQLMTKSCVWVDSLRKVDVGKTTESSQNPGRENGSTCCLTLHTSCPLKLRDLDASDTDAAALRVKSARESRSRWNPSAAPLLYFCSFHILSQKNLKLNTVLTIVNFWFQLSLT